MNNTEKVVDALRAVTGLVAMAAFVTAAASLFYNLPLAMAASLVAYCGAFIVKD